VDAKSNETFAVYNPSDDTLVSDKIQSAGEADVDAAVEAAKVAFKGPWGSMSATDRAGCMVSNYRALVHLPTTLAINASTFYFFEISFLTANASRVL
jgi:acyl-CoA reductase-like NAD-dependent aldehyde dehydrogenase